MSGDLLQPEPDGSFICADGAIVRFAGNPSEICNPSTLGFDVPNPLRACCYCTRGMPHTWNVHTRATSR